MSGGELLRSKGFRGVVIGVGSLLLGAALCLTGAFERLELTTWDWRAQLLVRESEATDDVVLILVNETDLDNVELQFGIEWPWPRSIYSYYLDFLNAGGVEAVAFDLIFKDAGVGGQADDLAFAYSMEQYGNVIIATTVGDEAGLDTSWIESVPRPPISLTGPADPEMEAALTYSRIDYPLPEFGQAAASLGNVFGQGDVDGLYRRSQPISFIDGQAVPSLSFAMVAATTPGGVPMELTSSSLIYGGVEVPLDQEGRALIRFTAEGGRHRQYAAYDILYNAYLMSIGEEPEIDPAEFEGKYVLFGLAATGLLDLRPTPMDPQAPGVTVHATMLDNLLGDAFMSDLPRWATILMIAALAIGAAMVATLITNTIAEILFFVLFLALPVGLAMGGYAIDLWVPFITPLVTVIVSLAGANVANYATEGRQKAYIKSAFSQYLSPTVIEELIADPDRLQLGGERRELSIFFSDLQGFTSISEGLSPEELTSLLNDYLSAMTDIIQDEGGTIDKYEGDAIIAFWNAPVEQLDHAKRGVRAALRCQTKLAEMRPGFKERTGRDLFMRIGMNTGPAVVGNMGSHTRFDYTMLGDAVNLAARLEGINKQYGTYTMISGSTLAAIDGIFKARELSRVAVVGRAEPVTVYEPMVDADWDRKAGVLPTFNQGLQLFYAGKFEEAAKIFDAIADADPPSFHYAAKCRDLLASPPDEWHGVWVMTSK